MRVPDVVEPGLANVGSVAYRGAEERTGDGWPLAVAFLDALATPVLGLLLEPLESGRTEIVALLLSGPLAALVLALTGAYHVSVLRSPL